MIRRATEADLDFLVHADVAADGDGMPEDVETHRTKIRAFVTDPTRAAYVHESDGRPPCSFAFGI